MKYEMNVLKVIPMTGRSNKPVPNQYFILNGADWVFQSYDSIVAEYNNDSGLLTINNQLANCSVTTKKYLNQVLDRFSQLNGHREEIKKAIKSDKRYTVISNYGGINIYSED